MTVKIEAGKYYRTRYGPAVGPMVELEPGGYDPEWAFTDGDTLWRLDGTENEVIGRESCYDLIAECTEIPETGKLSNINARPGDIVELVMAYGSFHPEYTDRYRGKKLIINDEGGVDPYEGGAQIWGGGNLHHFRIISRASDTPKTWGEMTNAEKGELLLADHEGRTIQLWHTRGGWVDSVEFGAVEDIAYRIKPKPVRETVTLRSEVAGLREAIDYITKVINDHPDLDSIKMEEV